ncbi:MAG: hypothetical protein J7501_11995 [Bdellovibrio sp.]|nr:hypothetical protein [Bdellovibrio sp.]
MKKFIAALTLILPLSASAIGIPAFTNAADARAYRALLQEYPLEIASFDGTTETPEVVAEFKSDWEAYIKGTKDLPAKWLVGHSWSTQLSDYFRDLSPSNMPVEVKDLIELRGRIDSQAEHSIKDPILYSQQRLGSAVVKAIQENKMAVNIYAGDVETLPGALKVSPAHIHFLPSPYDSWGLRKVYVASGTKSEAGRYVLVTPPSREYLLHYAMMFEYLGISVKKAIFNIADQERQVRRLAGQFEAIKAELARKKVKIDVLALGYYGIFRSEKLGLKRVTDQYLLSDGLTVQVLREIVDGKSINYLIVKSDLAIWGESSSKLIEAAMVLAPRSVLFMGSAGGINRKTNVYDITVPSEFKLLGNSIPVQNNVGLGMEGFIGPLPKVLMHATHGHTNSPIEQTKEFVTRKIMEGIDTYDVEQNLIAKAVVAYNLKNGTDVQFGAINLITDKPKSFLYDWAHEHDLTNIDVREKSVARIRAVNLALQAVRAAHVGHQAISCEAVFAAQ